MSGVCTFNKGPDGSFAATATAAALVLVRPCPRSPTVGTLIKVYSRWREVIDLDV